MELAANPRKVELTVEVGHANFILHGKPMPTEQAMTNRSE